jgi:hypothetical protein
VVVFSSYFKPSVPHRHLVYNKLAQKKKCQDSASIKQLLRALSPQSIAGRAGIKSLLFPFFIFSAIIKTISRKSIKYKRVKKTILSRIFLITGTFFVLFFLFVLGAAHASAATIYANYSTGNDTTGNGSSGTPYKTFYKAYTMAGSGDTLDLAGTFDWSNADETGDASTSGYTIGKNLTIRGQGAGTTFIQAASTANTANRRVFTISSSYTVTVQNLTLRYGKTTDYGGGVYIGGISTNVTFSGCSLEYNTVSASGYSYWYGGGAIFYENSSASGAQLIISNTTIKNNTVTNGWGGAVWHYHSSTGNSVVVITNSTLSGNTAALGTALAGYYGRYKVSDSTITGNTGSTTIILSNHGYGALYLTNVTLAYNTLGASAGTYGLSMEDVGTASFKNTIIAQNKLTGGTQYDYTRSGGSSPNNGYNLVETQSGSDFSNGVNGCITGVQANLNLSNTLGANGTLNSTETLALNTGSVAINTGATGTNGSESIPTTDQRGLPRVGATDMGAYEYGSSVNSAPSLTSIADSPDPIKGGSGITITPSGQTDVDSNDLYFYCNESGSATSANTSCSQGNTSYASGAYGSMTCSYNVSSGDTTRTVYCRTYDGTDYSTERTTTYTVDTTAPTVTDNIPAAWQTANTTVTLTCGDGTGVGCSKVYYTTDSSTPDTGSAYVDAASSWQFTHSTEGTATLKYRGYDSVGNLEEAVTATNSLRLDKTAPTTSDDFTHNNVWQNSNQTITLTPADATSGVNWTKYCTDTNNTCVPSSGTSYTGAVTLSTEGTNYFRYASLDNAGSTQTTVSKTVKIDKSEPTVNAGSDQTKNTSFTQNATVSDNISEVASYLWEKVSGPGTVTFGTATAEDTTVSASEDGTYVIRLTVTDNAGNSTYDEFELNWDTTSPTISNISSVPNANSAVASWNTDENASSQVEYGLVSSYGSTTTESDTTTRVSSHSVTLSSLQSCAHYYFRVKSEDEAGNQEISTQSAFNTSGCETSSIEDGNSAQMETAGGSVSVDTSIGTAAVTAPNNFYSESTNIQINKLDITSAPTAPASQNLVSDNLFSLLAVSTSGAAVTSFSQPITFTVSYSSNTEAAYDENTLAVYKYMNGSWENKNCTLDTSANTLTCLLSSFSVYAVFGEQVSGDHSPPIIAVGNHKTVNLSPNESVSLKSKKFTFRSNVPDLKKGDIVQIKKDGRLVKSVKINGKKRWNGRIKQTKNTTGTYQFRYLDKDTRAEIRVSSEYNILVDGHSPKFRNFPKSATVSPGDYISWTATDNDQLKYYQVRFQGKNTNVNEARFQIPSGARLGVSRLTVTAFDRAENSVTKKINIKVR